MEIARSRSWLPVAILLGLAYLAVGRLVVGPPAHAQAWRLAAWAISAVIYAGHICYEHFAQRSAPRALAAHVAVAVAIGGLGLAIAGMLHAWSTTSTIRPVWFLALVLWPLITAGPGFAGALIAGLVLGRVRPTGVISR
jgi:hypothetical protein